MRTTGAIAVVCGVVSSFVLGCGSGEPSAEARRVAADALGSGAYVVYGDALASGWVDWSWSSTRSFSNASPVASGTASVAVTLQGWGALSMHALSSTVTGMSALVLSVNGGAASGGDLQVGVTVGGTAQTPVMLAQYCAGKAIPANAWTRCTVPLSVMGAAGKALDGVYLRDITGSARPTLYVDDVAFTGSSSSSSSSGGSSSSSSSSSSGGSSSGGSSSSSSSSSGGAPAVTVTVTPAASNLDGCASAQLTATVTGASDTSVTWSVQEGTAGGTVSTTGKYTAPTAPGTYHVVAKSNAGAATAIATFTVQEHVLAVQITPGTVRVTPGGQVAFAATATTTCGTFALQ